VKEGWNMSVVTETAPGVRFLLHNIGWLTYGMMLTDLENSHVRLTYDRGKLELMAPTYRHEGWGRVIGRLLNVLTEELSIPAIEAGSTTFRREDLERGLEPDDCFYIASVGRIIGKTDIDLSRDPPPDLAIEVDVTRTSLDRMVIYAALRVPEVWRFDGESIEVNCLRADGTYETRDRSPTFPDLPLERFVEFALRATQTDATSLAKEFRAWVRQNLLPQRDDADGGNGQS
jgi:Uma2 family endonuclease